MLKNAQTLENPENPSFLPSGGKNFKIFASGRQKTRFPDFRAFERFLA